MSKTTTTTMALAAAALFLGGCNQDKAPTANPDDAAKASDGATATDAGAEKKVAKIKCFGVNECSGESGCDVPDDRVEPGSKGHACGGQNECKGKGWVLLSQADCDEQGGELL